MVVCLSFAGCFVTTPSQPGELCRSQVGSVASPNGDSWLLSSPFDTHAAQGLSNPIEGATTDLRSSLKAMTTLDEFKALRASVSPKVQADLFKLFTSDPEASYKRMVELAAEKGVTLTTEEVKGFLKQMDEDDEFDDIQLDAVALLAIAGGRGRNGCGCQEEAHDEPWGRCPGMRPMRKWLFGRNA